MLIPRDTKDLFVELAKLACAYKVSVMQIVLDLPTQRQTLREQKLAFRAETRRSLSYRLQISESVEWCEWMYGFRVFVTKEIRKKGKK